MQPLRLSTNLKSCVQDGSIQAAQLSLIRGEVKTELAAQRGVGGIGKLGEVSGAQISVSHL